MNTAGGARNPHHCMSTVECRNGLLVHKDGGVAVPLVDGEVLPGDNHVVVGAHRSRGIEKATKTVLLL